MDESKDGSDPPKFSGNNAMIRGLLDDCRYNRFLLHKTLSQNKEPHQRLGKESLNEMRYDVTVSNGAVATHYHGPA